MNVLQLCKDEVVNVIEEGSTIYVIQKNKEPFKIMYVSSNVKRILGLEEKEFVDKSEEWIKWIHPEDRERYEYLMANNAQGSNIIEYRFLYPDGNIKWLREESRSFVVNNEALLLRTIIDITSSRIKNDVYTTMFDSIEEGIVVLNREMIIRDANKGFYKIVNYSKGDLSGQNLLKIFEEKGYIKEKKLIEEVMFQLFNDKHTQRLTIKLVDNDSKPRYVDVHLYPVKTSTVEEVDTIIGVFIDVTEKKLLEDQLSYLQKMETVGQLSAGIAHDFNNLLTAVIGFASFIDIHIGEDSPLKDYVQNILKVADRGANLIRNLLTFSRKRTLQPVRCDVNNLILNVEPLLKRMVGEHITINFELSKNDLPVMADITQIDQVLLNLISNAKDAIEGKGEIVIKTQLFKIDADFIKRNGFGYPGDYALIMVSDNGIGMSDEVKRRIFDPFFTTKDVNKGTGLGMSIVYSIIKQHNGYISIDSREGTGTKVFLYIPIHQVYQPTEEDIKNAFLDVKGGCETILVAEDDDYVRDVINQILTNAGYKVILSRDGREALSEFIKHKGEISLAILDVIMPFKNGGEVFNDIKIINPSVKVIFLSGYSTEIMDSEVGISKQAVFISKPVTPKELLSKVRQILDGMLN